MNLTIIGTGFVGVVSSAVFASFGHHVFGLDVDEAKVEKLKQGIIPFYEPGLEELVKDGVKKGNLKFTTSYKEAISNSDVILIAVGTPSAKDGQADLTYVYKSAESMAPFLRDGAIVAIKSTVPPGTCDIVSQMIELTLTGTPSLEKKPYTPAPQPGKKLSIKYSVVSLPEFLREGSAVEDTLHPDRVILGATDPDTITKLTELHRPFNAPIVTMKPESAQMCKYASNAYLATRITFINQIANLCEVNGANILEVIKGIGMDKRIGSHYWYPGLGYGGSCFPKDVKELAAYARAVHQEDNLMVVISKLNNERIKTLLASFSKKVGGFANKKVAALGLSFKPNTSDIREAPSLIIIPALIKEGSVVSAFDPMATSSAKEELSRLGIKEGDNFALTTDIDSALKDADIVMCIVEWPELVTLDPTHIARFVKEHAWFIDCRDQYNRTAIEASGLRYIGIGL